jgi:hypothetical protein
VMETSMPPKERVPQLLGLFCRRYSAFFLA